MENRNQVALDRLHMKVVSLCLLPSTRESSTFFLMTIFLTIKSDITLKEPNQHYSTILYKRSELSLKNQDSSTNSHMIRYLVAQNTVVMGGKVVLCYNAEQKQKGIRRGSLSPPSSEKLHGDHHACAVSRLTIQLTHSLNKFTSCIHKSTLDCGIFGTISDSLCFYELKVSETDQ